MMKYFQVNSLKEFVRNYPVTTLIFSIVTIVHVFTYIMGNGPTDLETARKFGALLSRNKDISELPYLLTATYQHIGGMFHYVSNMIALLLCAPYIERMFGAVRFAIVFNVSGIFASLSTLLLFDNVIYSGASGSIFGLLGVYMALYVKEYPWMNRQVKKLWPVIFIFALLSTFIDPNVSVVGHSAGLIAGFCLGLIIHPKPEEWMEKYQLKKVIQFLGITVCLYFSLYIPQSIASPFSSIHWNPVLQREIGYLTDTYNEYAYVYYNELLDMKNGDHTLTKHQLKQMALDIQSKIEELDGRASLPETEKGMENLKAVFEGLLEINELMQKQMEKSNPKLEKEIALKFSEVYRTILIFMESSVYDHT